MYKSAYCRRVRLIQNRTTTEANLLMALLTKPVGQALVRTMLQDVSLSTLINLKIDANSGALMWKSNWSNQAELPLIANQLAILPPEASQESNEVAEQVSLGAAGDSSVPESVSNIQNGTFSEAIFSSDAQMSNCSCEQCRQWQTFNDNVLCDCGEHHQESTEFSYSDLSLMAIAEFPEQSTEPSNAYLPWRQNSEWQPFTGKNQLMGRKLLTRVCSPSNMSKSKTKLVFRNHNFGLPPRDPCPTTSNCSACVLGRGRKIAYNFSTLLKRKRHLLLQHRYDKLMKETGLSTTSQRRASVKSQRSQRKSQH